MKTVVVEVGDQTVVEITQDPANVVEITESPVGNVQPVERPDSDAVLVEATAPTILAVENPPPAIVEVVAAGPQGPPGERGLQGVPGPPGSGVEASLIAGYPVGVTDGQEDDLLGFTGAEWRNKPQKLVTDGGNF